MKTISEKEWMQAFEKCKQEQLNARRVNFTPLEIKTAKEAIRQGVGSVWAHRHWVEMTGVERKFNSVRALFTKVRGSKV
jgi:hypothetical protein